MQIEKNIRYQKAAGLRAADIPPDGEDKKIIRGYAILFDSPADLGGGWTEYVRRGAFDGVDLSDLMLLSNHDTTLALAKNGINLRAEVDDTGLFVESELPDTQTARDVYELVRRGIVPGMSYWFSASKTHINEESKTVEILKFEWIREVSIVAFPAYPETLVIAVEKENSKNEEKSEKQNLLL